jgi:uncharacterized RDD family membrane protein YckC
MSCPLWGAVCHCASGIRPRMKPRFKPDAEAVPSTRPSAMLIDPEAYDASEQQFAASLEETPAPRPRFVVEEKPLGTSAVTLSIQFADTPEGVDTPELAAEGSPAGIEMPMAGTQETGQAGQTDLLQPQDADSWRQEVTARVNSYRSRRHPRGPRYPSLMLSFEPVEPSWNTHSAELSAPASGSRQAVAVQTASPAPETTQTVAAEETTARIIEFPVIEFPRSANAPPRPLDELADPVLDRPRILEAPELVPSPPALGGILMDPVETEANERRPGFEMPLQSAPMAHRLAATAVDSLLVLCAFAAFAYIFFRITTVIPPLQQAVETAISLIGLFWAAYQYLLLVHAGTTPGLKLAKLQLSRFDGSPVPRRTRRWRVLVSVLSGLSLGLGYAWCFLDEDELCWHDRITRTYMAPRKLS